MKHKTRIVLSAIFVFLSLAASAQPERYIAGTDYLVVENPGRTTNTDVIEVTEYFSYGCPGCFLFEPILSDWIADLPDDVQCRRLPAIWSESYTLLAQTYYTAEHLGILGQIHEPLFNAIHVEGKRLEKDEDLATLFSTYGVSEESFTRAFNSFNVNTRLNQARQEARHYGSQLRGTPSLIINGKYIVTLSQDTLDIANFLIGKERREGT